MQLKGLDECFKLSSWVRGGAPKPLHFSAVFGIKSNTFYSYLHNSGVVSALPVGSVGDWDKFKLSACLQQILICKNCSTIFKLWD